MAGYGAQMKDDLKQELAQQMQAVSPQMKAQMQSFRAQMDANKEDIRQSVSALKQQMPSMTTDAFEDRMETMKAQFPRLSMGELQTKAKQDLMRRWREQE